MSTIRLRNVSKVFGDDSHKARALLQEGRSRDEILAETGYVVAVRDVNLDIADGEIFVVMGLSGSGKSTLIRCINRLHPVTTGEVLIDGEDIVSVSTDRLRELRRSKLAMVFQHFGLFPHRTVQENVEYGLKMQKMDADERRARSETALEQVGLEGWGNRRPRDLSGGMQQRVGLARALATDADVLLMDEAFSALDPLIRREMQDDLLTLQRDLGKTIVFITHDLNEALKLGDHTAIMRDGQVVQVGTADEIVSEPSTEYVLEFTRDVDRSRVLTVGSIMRQSDTLVQGRDTVRTASARMRASDSDYMVLVDSNRQPLGLVLEEHVGPAMQRGVNDLGDVVSDSFVSCSTNDLLIDTYDSAIKGHCIVVVDEHGQLAGVAEHLDILSSLAPATEITPTVSSSSSNGTSADTSTESGGEQTIPAESAR